MNELKKLDQNFKNIEEKLDYTFKNHKLLVLAFVHRSFVNENRDIIEEHNERLEFLGDAILGIVVTEFLYKNLPTTPEGQLSSLRARIVNSSSCTSYVKTLAVEDYILLGKGEKMNNRRGKDSISADLFEAIMGAIYLDGDIEAAREFFLKHFKKEVLKTLEEPSRNWKAKLQDYSQKKYQVPPIYKVLEESGPDHNKTFAVSVFVNEKEAGIGKGESKKEAEQNAASIAMSKIIE